MRGARHNGMSPFRAGLLAVIVVAVACYFAFSRANPFSSPYTFTAEFANAANVKPGAAVRIAGVEVGKVKDVQPASANNGTSKVKIEVLDKGLPIHRDAEI